MSHVRYRGGEEAEDEEAKKFDPEIHAVTTSDALHRLTHDGMVFHASGKVLAWADEAVNDFLFAVPASVSPHIHSVQLNFGRGDVDLVAYKDTLVSANGGALTSNNANQNSIITPDLILYGGPTVTDPGTVLHTIWTPPTAAGIGQSTTGVVGEQGEEWILKPSTNYLFRITNNSGAVMDFAYEISWFEPSYET